jgi:enoyl-[acyl-carrier protein] reductase III
MTKDILSRVVDCLATTTRYPTQLLTADADLENDLGIDSVKLVEIVIALAEEFGIELENKERDPSIRTIEHLASWIDGFLKPSDPVQVDSPILNRQSPPMNGDHRVHVNHTAPPQSISTPHFAVNGSVAEKAEKVVTKKPLSGRVALVTGSGRGIGRTIARVLAERGATVIVNSFHSRDQGEQTVAEITAQGGSAVHIWGSVANPEHVESMFVKIEKEYGLDILVCNASDGRIGSFLDLTSEDWDKAFRTNVSGHHQCAIRAARLMRARGGGSIVTMSAVGAHQFIDGLGSQGVVKAAVESLTRYLACELGRFGIRVNCVAGGPVYGDLLSKFPSARATQDYWESIIPDGELCSPMDLAHTIAFLVGEEARGINGAVWMVDHGFSANADGQPLNRVSREPVRVPSF